MKACCWITIGLLASGWLNTEICAAAEPANPHANPRARAVLNLLESLPGRSEKRLLSGQFAGFGTGALLRACESAYEKTGHWPAMIGLDYAEFRTGGLDYTAVNRLAIDYARKGGLVTISARPLQPRQPAGRRIT